MSLRRMILSRLFGRNRDCVEVRKLASDFLEEDISQQDKERILKHLEECEECPSFFDTLHSTITMLRNLPSHVVPQKLKDRLSDIPNKEGEASS